MPNSSSTTIMQEISVNPVSPSYSRNRFLWAIFALSFATFAIGISQFAVMSMLNDIVQEFHKTAAQGQSVISSYALGVVVGAPALAIMTSKVDRKKLLICLLIFYCIANALTALAPTYEALLCARFLSGLVHGTYFAVASLVAMYISPPEASAKAVSFVNVGLSIATMLGVPVMQLLGEDFDWRMAYWVVVVCSIISIVFLILALPSTQGMHVYNPMREIAALKNMNLWLTLLIGVVGFGATFAVFAYIDYTFHQVAFLTENQITIGLMLFGLGMILGGLLGGKLADWNLDGTLFLAMAGQIIIMFLFLVLAHKGVWILPATFLIGVTGAFIVPALQTRLIYVASEEASSISSALNQSALNLANAIGPWLAGIGLSMTNDNFDCPTYVAIGLSMGGLLMVLLAITYVRKHPIEDTAVSNA